MRFVLVLLFFLFACSNDAAIPKGILSPDKMEAILYDAVRADELVDFSTSVDSTYRGFTKRGALYDSLFSLHLISKKEYEASLQFYQSRPDLLKKIFEALQKKTDSTFKPVQAL